jgi:hypothetical protein
LIPNPVDFVGSGPEAWAEQLLGVWYKIKPMRRPLLVIVLVQALLVAGLGLLLRDRRVPLGVRGEWEWQRIAAAPNRAGTMVALGGLAGLALVAGLGARALSRKGGLGREALWLGGLVAAAIGVQVLLQEGAPFGYGLTKWTFALHSPGSSGYYTIAKAQVRNPWRFLVDYPRWLREQEVPRHGAHPPGLYLVAHGLLRLMEKHPAAAKVVVDHLPESVAAGFREIGALPRADRAALAVTGALTLLACAGTVVPLYLLARSSLPPAAAWAATTFWPVVPSALLFQPAADTAFPLLATTALALAAWASRGRALGAVGAGVVLALGMLFTLAFVPVGLVVALGVVLAPGVGWTRKAGLVLATGIGFLGLSLAVWGFSGANPFVIWWWNQYHHARFYQAFSRSYLAWMVINPIELLVALGLPAAVWVGVGLAFRQSPRVAWATLFVLAILTVTGKNLSEIARLWLPYMPALLVAAGAGWERFSEAGWALPVSIGLMGLQVLLMEAMIQVVYAI